MKARHIVGAVLAALLIAAVLYLYGRRQTPSAQAPLQNVTTQNVTEIKNDFNAAKRDVRVLLLLSPNLIRVCRGPLQSITFWRILPVSKYGPSSSGSPCCSRIGRHLPQRLWRGFRLPALHNSGTREG